MAAESLEFWCLRHNTGPVSHHDETSSNRSDGENTPVRIVFLDGRNNTGEVMDWLNWFNGHSVRPARYSSMRAATISGVTRESGTGA